MARRRPKPLVPRPLLTDEPVADAVVERTHWLAVLEKLLPELWLALVALVLAVRPELVSPALHDGLVMVALAEVFFAMASASITDVATRLRKRPPLWLAAVVVVGILIFNPDAVQFLRHAFALGWAIFLPFAWSVVERVREVWTMPGAPRIEKLRRRALVSGRLSLVLVGGGLAVAIACISYLLDPDNGGFVLMQRLAPWMLAAAFGLAAADVVRVHRPAFARRPTALVPGLDPLGVDYLHPL